MNLNAITLDGRTFCIFGLRGAGKSTLADYIGRLYGAAALIYDTTHEYDKTATYAIYRPTQRNDVAELSKVVTAVLKSRSYKLLLIDEANRYAPPKPAPLPPALADLNDQCRHYGLAVGYIARRPVQLNQDLTELADYLFLYHLKGNADRQYLSNISPGLGDAAAGLPPAYFAFVAPNRDFTIYSPIPAAESWLKRPGAGVQLDK